MAEEIEFEYEIRSIPVDDKMMNTIAQIMQEGWQMVQGVKPVAIYHLIRPKNKPSVGGGLGVLHIDDSKVRILRKDGTLE